MIDYEAMKRLPIYAATDVKVYEPQKKKPLRMELDDKAHSIWKKHGITLMGSLALMIWTVLTCCITGVIVRNNTTLEVTERVTAEMRQNFSVYLAEQEEAASRERFLSGEASREAAIKSDAVLLAKVGQGVLNTYKAADMQDAEKVMICVLCRVHSGGEFANIRSIDDAVNQAGQWWGYSEDMSYTEDVFKAALKVSGIFHNAEPMPCQSDMVYAGWTGSEIVLRNQWTANASARYY